MSRGRRNHGFAPTIRRLSERGDDRANQRPVIFETLEPRILLNSDPFSSLLTTTTLSPPPVLVAKLAVDAGISATDGLTNDPTVQGILRDIIPGANGDTAFAQIASFKGGLDKALPTAFADLLSLLDDDGNFVLDRARLDAMAGGTLADGKHVLNLVAKDTAGEESKISLTFTLDTSAVTGTAALIKDTAVAGDSITADPSVQGKFTGAMGLKAAFDTTNPESFINLAGALKADGSFRLDSKTIDQLGGGYLADGAHTLNLIGYDNAGNERSVTVNFTLDRSGPTIAFLTLQSASDSGVAGDRRTTAATATLIGETSPGAKVTLVQGNKTVVADNNGRFSFENIALANGANTFITKAVDQHGNVSQPASSTITRVGPITASLAVDSGASNSDGLTKQVAFTGTVADFLRASQSGTSTSLVTFKGGIDGAAVADYRNLFSKYNSSTKAFAFNLSDVFAGVLPQGKHTLHLIATDSAGKAASFDLVFTLDTAGPTAVTSVALANDTGSSKTDKITSDATVAGKLDGAVALSGLIGSPGGTYIDLLSTLKPDGTFRLDPAKMTQLAGDTLTDGSKTLRLLAVDKAGNETSFELTFTLDRQAPAAPTLVLATASDSGETADNRTSLATGTLTGTAEVGALVTLMQGTKSLGTATATGGTYSFANIAFAVGTNTFTVKAADAAGNTSNATTTITRVGPLTASLQADTGASATDRITKNATVVGSLRDLIALGGVNVALTSFKASLDSTAPASFVDLIGLVQPNGTFTIPQSQLVTLAGGTLKEGAHTLRLTAATANQTATFELKFDYDSTAATGTVALTSDTGASKTDKVTKDPSVNGTLTGATGLRGGLDTGPLIDLASALTPAGAFKLDAAKMRTLGGGTLADGTHTLHLLAIDKAGNERPIDLTFTLDTAAPNAPTIGLATASDSGVVGDLKTTSATVNLTGTAIAGAAVTLVQGAKKTVVTADATTGVFTFNNVALAAGANAMSVSVDDTAGNTATNSFTVTRVTPITVRLVSDTGISATDGLTNASEISGSVADFLQPAGISAKTLASFKGGLDNTAPAAYADLTSLVNPDGTFNITAAKLDELAGGTLSAGTHKFKCVATDSGGNIANIEFSFTIDRTGPGGTAKLSKDTGASPTDGITSDATVEGKLTEAVGLKGGFNSAALNSYVDLLSTLMPNGTFRLDPAKLNQIFGGTLTNGQHTLHLVASDKAGNTRTIDVVFTLDRVAPTTPTLNLAAASDTGVVGDKITTLDTVELKGNTAAGATVTLVQLNRTTTADATTGAFSFTGVSLPVGTSPFTVTAVDLAGNQSKFSINVSRQNVNQSNAAVLYWGNVALNTIKAESAKPPISSRALAIESIAVLDTINAFDATKPGFLVTLNAPTGASMEAAIAAAAYWSLVRVIPSQSAILSAAYQTALANIANDQAKTDGIALGLEVAERVYTIRHSDGSENFVQDSGSTTPGKWRPTEPAFDEGLLPQWATLTPFAMTSASQFRPAGPPAMTTDRYAADLNEVKLLGAGVNSTRTPEQTEIARFWADGDGTFTPPGHWNLLALQLASQKNLSLSDTAQLMAMMGVASADAAVASWDAKYFYDMWRPETAIQRAAEDGNAKTTADPNWRPLLLTPPFPDYISGHSTFSGAAATILAGVFGDKTSFALDSISLGGVTRTFTSFSSAAQEAGRSRIYGGIHVQSANIDGVATGQKVANHVLETFGKTSVADKQAPKIFFQEFADEGRTVPVLRGQVIDRSGVTSLFVSVDGGSQRTVTLNDTGSFEVQLGLPLDGDSDGAHVMTFVATDTKGNKTAAQNVTFVLDTKGPVVTLTGLQENDSLTPESRLAGTADPGPGSQLAGLSYSFNGGLDVPVEFVAETGAFDSAIDYSKLNVGTHLFELKATDVSGNVTRSSFSVVVDTLTRFRIVASLPADGAEEVSPIFRPKITFSRQFDRTTITDETVYATDSTGERLAATLVFSQDNTSVSLFFTERLPSSSQISIHINGSRIKGAADGISLDADGDGVDGGTYETSFTTVSTAVVPGTTIVGQVVDPGGDLKPMTFDDMRVGPDGIPLTPDDIFLNPIAHAKVFVLGLEDQFVYTDAQGRFTLTGVPTGNVKLAIDGRTATNIPAGANYFWPEMVMDMTVRPGVQNTVMDTMANNTVAEQLAFEARKEVYLPRLAATIFTSIGNGAPTTVTVDAAAAPDLTTEERAGLRLVVQPGSVIGEDGLPVANPEVGISTVPAELVREMLPPGVIQHTFDITIQARGAVGFTANAQLTLPNVFNAAPGTKLNLLSFDHTTGRLIIDGTATVSADGKTVVTDPGAGVTRPGWHGMTPPGSPTKGPGNSNGPNGPTGPADPDKPPPPPDCGPSKPLSFSEKVSAYASIAKDCAQILLALNPLKFVTALKVIKDLGDFTSIAADLYTQYNALNQAIASGQRGDEIKARIAGVSASVKAGLFEAESLVKNATATVDRVKDALSGAGALLDGIQQAIKLFKPDCPSKSTSYWIDKIDSLVGKAKSAVAYVDNIYNSVKDGLVKFAFKQLTLELDEIVNKLDAAQQQQASGPGSRAFAVAPSLQIALANADTTFREMLAARTAMLNGIADAEKELAKVAPEKLTNLLGNAAQGLFGTPKNAYYSITYDGNAVRGKLDAKGQFDVFLPENTTFQLAIYNADIEAAAFYTGKTGPSGTPTEIPYLLYEPIAGLLDTDKDVLPDSVENIIGTNPRMRDTNSDGISDYAAIRAGLNPTDGRAVATGIVATIPLQGEARAVAVVGATSDTSQQTVYVATGNYGLAIVDAANFTRPRLQGQIDLAGVNTDIVADGPRELAAVASTVGLHLVDTSNPTGPSLLQTVAFADPVVALALRDGTVYAATGTKIVALDMNTGDIRQVLDLSETGHTNVKSLAFDGATLLAMDSNRSLTAVTIANEVMTVRGSLMLTSANGKIFSGGGTAYVGTTSEFSQGYASVDITNPDNLVLISGIDSTTIAGQALAATGSGLMVSVGVLQGQGFALDVSNISDPANTGRFVTRIALPNAPYDVKLANALAFVADGTGGLQIVNYLSADNQGVAPTVSIQIDGQDIDPSRTGIQVLEGRTIQILPALADDVQVRNVEVLVNGQVVSNDVSYPYDLSADIPKIANGVSTVTVQVRATDTGGNSTLSNLITLDIVRDTFAPAVSRSNVAEGAALFFARSVELTFDEPLDVSKLSTSAITLVKKGFDGIAGTADDIAVPVRIDTRAGGSVVAIIPESYLLPGDYQLKLMPAAVADRVGNAIATPIVRNFSIRPSIDIHAVSGTPVIAEAPSANPGQEIAISVPFDPVSAKAAFRVINSSGTLSTREISVSRVDLATGTAFFKVPDDATTDVANGIEIFARVNGVKQPFADGNIFLQIVPVVVGLDVESVSSDGTSAQVILTGAGFIEGAGRYLFGTTEVVDATSSTGPDVSYSYAPNYTENGWVRLTVPLVAGVLGPVTVVTAGGTSTVFSTSFGDVTSVALSGTPANAAEASANPGQAVTLTGTGFTTSSDIFLSYLESGSGAKRTVLLNPVSASGDGTQATLVIPRYANGAFTLQRLGSSEQHLLQIVPMLTGYDVSGTNLRLNGYGLAEGNNSTYNFAGGTLTDTAGQAGPDVHGHSVENDRVNLPTEPVHGFGTVSVTTAGGTSAVLDLNTLRPNLGANITPRDVAIDGSGQVWVGDTSGTARIMRLDANGAIAQTITLTGTSFYGGLQFAPSTFTLGSTSVPAGSLLVFNGAPNPDTVTARNPSTGAVIATLNLNGGAGNNHNYDLTGGVYDAASGSLLVIDRRNNPDVVQKINPATGAVTGSFNLPFENGNAGLAIHPVSGNLWYGTTNSTDLVEMSIATGQVLRRVDLAAQGVNDNEITGLAFAADGKLLVSSTHGMIYRVDLTLDTVATTKPVLTSIVSLAQNGTAANGAVASANIGQVVELHGSNFGANTQVLFGTRDGEGRSGLVAVAPQVVSADGTVLQVLVPNLASTGDIRVVNTGSLSNAGAVSHTDGIYRKVSLNFTADQSGNASLRFADNGLQGISDESWGLDNVRVLDGATMSQVFADNFESGADGRWSSSLTDDSAPGTLTRYSGRFNNAAQTLALNGLDPGSSYTVEFDLYILDSWDGTDGQDLFEVSANGQLLMREAFSNYSLTVAQTFNASTGQRLQIVPTLTGITNGRPGQDDTFELIGSGFQEGASTVTVGGVVRQDLYVNQYDLDVYGSRNDNYRLTVPLSVEGPIRVTTEGGYAQIAGPVLTGQTGVQFTSIVASAGMGTPSDPAVASANAGQTITLKGQGFNSQTLVQFTGTDAAGVSGTITRTGNASSDGKTLNVDVPALATTGAVRVLGSTASFNLQIVPSLRSVGGTIASGNTLVLEGSGLAGATILIDGQPATVVSTRTVSGSTTGNIDTQQLITVVVPAGISGGAHTVTATRVQGGSSEWKVRNIASIVTDPADEPAGDVGDVFAAARTLNLAADHRTVLKVNIGNGTNGAKDVDLYQFTLNAADALSITRPNGTSPYLDGFARIFDATGQQLATADDSDLTFTSPANGTYYLGISSYSSRNYDPTVAASGSAGPTGTMEITIERRDAAGTLLTSISAPAISGTAAVAGVAAANAGQTITLNGSGLVANEAIIFTAIDSSGRLYERQVTAASVATDGNSLTVVVPYEATTGTVRLMRDRAGILLQIVPTLADVSVGYNGSPFTGSSLSLTGSGFAEGSTTVQFGNTVFTDASPSAGLDVYYGYNPNYIENGTVALTTPNGIPTGPIRVTTAGGTSATLGLTFTAIVASATVGTPANSGVASANAGQTIEIQGSGFDTSTDVVFRTVDSAGTRRDIVVRPTSVNGTGTSAQIVVPNNALTGSIRIVGDSTGAEISLQIVPVLTSVDISGGTVRLIGKGFTEGSSVYQFAGNYVVDTGNGGPDVYDYSNLNTNVNLAQPIHGFGTVSVTTEGGQSQALQINQMQPRLGYLHDVAYDAAGNVWVVNDANPASIQKLDSTNGQVRQSITLNTAAFGSTSFYGGLQSLSASMTLNGVNVPTGSLLLFNGAPSGDRIIAIDPTTGNVIASQTIGNHDMKAGVYIASTNEFVIVSSGSQLIRLNSAGGVITSAASPLGIGEAGLAIGPSGTFWLGSTGSNEVVEINATTLGQVRRINLVSQNIDDNEITGLAFDGTGNLLASSSQGMVYRVTLPA